MPKSHPQNELLVYEAVTSGELEIDSEGRIWRVKKRTADRWTGSTKTTPCKRVRAEMANTNGYLQVRVMRDGKRAYAAAHRLVWLHFHGPIPQGMTINHKQGLKTDNRPTELELATYSDQRYHAINTLGARPHDVKGAKHPKTELTDEDVLEMRRMRSEGEKVMSIAARYKMKRKAVSAILCRKTWRHLP
jgi:hypothetical protein